MNAEIISIGTELLLGHTINTDAAHVARELSALGIGLYRTTVVGDIGLLVTMRERCTINENPRTFSKNVCMRIYLNI